MKTLLTILLFLGITTICHSQTVFTVKYIEEANVKIYVSMDSVASDITVYQTQNINDATGNSGIWFFSGFSTGNSKNIFFVDNAADADLIVYYTSNASGGHWINNAKMGLMN